MILGPQYEHHVGTPNFMAPEVVNGKANDRRSDLWSLGCMIYQAALGNPPFRAATPFLILNKAQARDLWSPANLDATLKNLVDQLVHVEADARLGAFGGTITVLEHAFLSGSTAAPPELTVLQQGLECVGRAVADEVKADLDAEAAEKAALNEDCPMVSMQGTLRPGEATSRLINELSGILSENSDEGCRALLEWVESICSASGLSQLPADFASVSSGSALPEACKLHLTRFAEQASQHRVEAKEDPFAGFDDSDEDSDQCSGSGSSNASYNDG